MAYFKTYRGARLDLEFYRGKASIDYEVEVLNDDETEFDLSIYDDITLKIFHKIHGTEVLELTIDNGGIGINSSPADNFVIINLSDSQSDLRPKEYWYECYGTVQDGNEELIFFGVAKVL